jgi:pectin methylesterase-like acyl-CoA thioesterase
MLGLALFLCLAADKSVFTVAADGSGDFKSVQMAVDAAPLSGATIFIRPGIYREKLLLTKGHLQLRGTGTDASKVVLNYDDSAGTAGGTTKSASVTVSGDDFYAENLTVENAFSRTRPLTHEGSQAVALKISGDRSVLRNVRFLGYQDTLYANGKPARQYFADCYIEGNVDFIFGDARAFFENCEIHSKAHSTVMITAQSKLHPEEQSGYVFGHCRLTADADAKDVYLGRPWRAYATVVFMNTEMGPWIAPEGWHEWEHDGKPSLPTVFYAEYKSCGPGANPARRQLSDAEAKKFAVTTFFDGWNPAEVRPSGSGSK